MRELGSLAVLAAWSIAMFAEGVHIGMRHDHPRAYQEGAYAAAPLAFAKGVAWGADRVEASVEQEQATERTKFTPPAKAPPPCHIERGADCASGEAPGDWQPPARFQGALLTAVYWADPAEVARQCGGKDVVACQQSATADGAPRRPLLVMPNPCRYYDVYALMLCHELGHAHGWPGDHAGGHWTPSGSLPGA